jgi:hypothetical protein
MSVVGEKKKAVSNWGNNADGPKIAGIAPAIFILLLRLIQEDLLFLPLTCHGHDPIGESDVQPFIVTFDWQLQRRRWQQVLQKHKTL